MPEITVALDARHLAGEAKGIGRYLHTLLAGMSALPSPPAFVLISDRDLDVAYPDLSLKAVVARARPVYAWEQFVLPRELRRAGADLFHAPGNALPLEPPRPTVLTLHDAMMFERRFHTFAANRYYVYQSWVLKRAAQRCAAVITVSRTSAQDIKEQLGSKAAARVTVIEEAVDPVFFEKRTTADLAAFRQRLYLPARYMLHLGAAFPRKNTRFTIEAFARVAADEDVPDLVIGGVAGDDEEAIRGWVKEAGVAKRVRIQHYLSRADHVLLVAGAEMLLYPSEYEGFGLPALEAMVVGVPVVASARGALPETCGEAAYYVELVVDELATAMKSLATDEGKRRTLVAIGEQHVKKYSPRRMASRTLEVYRSVLATTKK
jgi:glycosyltransferase involved in cell wall biosynthesis